MKWLLLILITLAAWLQEPKFQTRLHEVVVPDSVIGKGGHLIESLTAADFVVLNDGKPQTVRLISQSSDPLPVEAVIVVQTRCQSASTSENSEDGIHRQRLHYKQHGHWTTQSDRRDYGL